MSTKQQRDVLALHHSNATVKETITNEEHNAAMLKNLFSSTRKAAQAHVNAINFGTSQSQTQSCVIAAESRDENIQDRATNGAGVLDVRSDSQTTHEEDEYKAVLSILDKNISSANAKHPVKERNGKSTSIERRAETGQCFSPGKTLGESFRHFMRLHRCEPLLDADDESLSYHPKLKINDEESINDKTKISNEEVSHSQKSNLFDDSEMGEKRDLMQILRFEFDASRESLSNTESTLSADNQNVSDRQVEEWADQRRQFEDLVVRKKCLEAQLHTNEEHLVEVKSEMIQVNTSLMLVQEENGNLRERITELERENNDLQEKLSEKGLSETKQKDGLDSWVNEKSMFEKSIQQLRLDLNEAHSTVKRIEKERKRERRHYHRLVEIATNEKADMDLRLELEVESNLETRKKCYVLEQKLAASKKKEAELASQIKFELESIQVNGAAKESQHEELTRLQGATKSLKEELAIQKKENSKLRKELSHKNEITEDNKSDEIKQLQDQLLRLCKANEKLRKNEEKMKLEVKQLRQIHEVPEKAANANDDGHGKSKMITLHPTSAPTSSESAKRSYSPLSSSPKAQAENLRLREMFNGEINDRPAFSGDSSKHRGNYEDGLPLASDTDRDSISKMKENQIFKCRLEELHLKEKKEISDARDRFEQLCSEFKKASKTSSESTTFLAREIGENFEQWRSLEVSQTAFDKNSPLRATPGVTFDSAATPTRSKDKMFGSNDYRLPDIPVSKRVEKLKKKYCRVRP